MENDSDSGHLVSPCTRWRSLFSHLQQWRYPCTLQRVISFDGNRTEHKAIYGPPIATRPPLFQYTHHRVEIGEGVEIFIQQY